MSVRASVLPVGVVSIVALLGTGCPQAPPASAPAPAPPRSTSSSSTARTTQSVAPPTPVKARLLFSAANSRCEEAAARRSIDVVLRLEGGERLDQAVKATVVASGAGKLPVQLARPEVTFVAGSADNARVAIEVEIVDDRKPEPDSEVVLELRAPDGVSVGEPAQHRLTIVDDDPLIITTLTGHDGTVYEPGDVGGATLQSPRSLAIGRDGTLYVADAHKVRAVGPDGKVKTIVNRSASNGDMGDGRAAEWALLTNPSGLTTSPDGAALLIADQGNCRVRRLDLASRLISTIAGNGHVPEQLSDGQPMTGAIGEPRGLAFGAEGTLFVLEARTWRVLAIDLAAGTLRVVAGVGMPDPGGHGDGGPAIRAHLRDPRAICVALDGALLIAERTGHRVRRIAKDGTISTLAGTGERGASGDGGPASQAQLDGPCGLAIDGVGNVLVADTNNHRIRRIDSTTGMISTIAGTGAAGLAGDGGPAHAAQLRFPEAIVVAGDGVTLLVADGGNKRIRRIAPAEK